MSSERYLEIGRVLKPHGVRGEVKVFPLTDDPKRFTRLERVYGRKDNDRQVLHIETVRVPKADLVLVKFKDISTPEQADLLRNIVLEIPRSEAPPLPKGKVYFGDVIGMEVRRTDTREHVGTVRSIVSAGNDLLEVETRTGELLIPWVEALVEKIDTEARTVWVVPLPGLLEP